MEATRLHLSDPPYENYFYSDPRGASHVVITTPLEDSNLEVIKPRLLVAWPAGNSGVVAFFAPQNGVEGSLTLKLVNETDGDALSAVYETATQSGDNPQVGVQGTIELNTSASLDITILGSIRSIRDYTEGGAILRPEIQDTIKVREDGTGGVIISRLLFDNTTIICLKFRPSSNGSHIKAENGTVNFEPGRYIFSALSNYAQLEQLSPQEVLSHAAQDLISRYPDQTASLSFLSYSKKLLAGTWRFLNYFGRDSMISLLLLQPVLSEGENGAIEAVIIAVLERLNKTDGTVAHEETIGDYATWLSMQEGGQDPSPQYDYKMIDSDYYLPIVMVNYFLDTEVGQARTEDFLSTKASENPRNAGLTFRELATINAEKIIRTSAPFAEEGGQVESNLIRLHEGVPVGEWRDSNDGLGGARIPYSVNAAMVPAGLQAIAKLTEAGFFPQHPEWRELATQYARIWEDKALDFFKVEIPQQDAKTLVGDYISEVGVGEMATTQNITTPITFYGLGLGGENTENIVRVMNTDDCFRLYLLNSTNQAQLTTFIDQTATNILLPFPLGLSTPVGLVVANPAYGGEPWYTQTFPNNAYHGTVIWGWQLAMMAAGLERQLSLCNTSSPPDFFRNEAVYGKVVKAYNHLWDVLEANEQYLSGELWSWTYEDGGFRYTPFGTLAPPEGMAATESNISQLWSLTFLALKRNEKFRV
ncbi:glycogen debranching enzyme [Patellaria atrata CBS 101060]|uniref:Glycogen debranching enzyme n=1 Tax=Patellaria atrata CBS 101060 TaxID=1346257 RepID=A0A9P4VTV2_9PEZI|nr:glycogen debranching enzyme [Patellaria atrata CBS 101060]